jgi:hypothetical protein
VLVRDLREALARLNPQLPPPAIDDAVTQLMHHDLARWPMRWRAVYTSDETKRRYETLLRVVFARFKALLVEPSALV